MNNDYAAAFTAADSSPDPESWAKNPMMTLGQFVSEQVVEVLDPGEDPIPCLLTTTSLTDLSDVNAYPIDPRFLQDESSKDILFGKVLPAIIEEAKPQAACLLVCAWTIPQEYMPRLADGSRVEIDDLPRPSEHPERQECIALTAWEADGRVVMGMGLMDRDEKGVVTIKSWSITEPDRLEGRITLVGDAIQKVRDRS